MDNIYTIPVNEAFEASAADSVKVIPIKVESSKVSVCSVSTCP